MSGSYDDFHASGYGSSMSYEQWRIENSPPTVLKSAKSAYDDFHASGYGSSMSFENYCRKNGIALIDSVMPYCAGNTPLGNPSAKQAVEKARKATVRSSDVKRSELIEMAKAKAETITSISSEEIDEWRIANGYYWKVTSPSGKVYSEVLKSVTLNEPDNYVQFNAMKIAYFRIKGYNY